MNTIIMSAIGGAIIGGFLWGLTKLSNLAAGALAGWMTKRR